MSPKESEDYVSWRDVVNTSLEELEIRLKIALPGISFCRFEEIESPLLVDRTISLSLVVFSSQREDYSGPFSIKKHEAGVATTEKALRNILSPWKSSHIFLSPGRPIDLKSANTFTLRIYPLAKSEYSLIINGDMFNE